MDHPLATKQEPYSERLLKAPVTFSSSCQLASLKTTFERCLGCFCHKTTEITVILARTALRFTQLALCMLQIHFIAYAVITCTFRWPKNQTQLYQTGFCGLHPSGEKRGSMWPRPLTSPFSPSPSLGDVLECQMFVECSINLQGVHGECLLWCPHNNATLCACFSDSHLRTGCLGQFCDIRVAVDSYNVSTCSLLHTY